MNIRYIIYSISNSILLLFLLTLWGCGGNKSLLNPELTLFKAQAQKDLVAGVKNEVKEVKAQMDSLVKAQVNLQSQIDSEVEARFNTQAGFNNRQDETNIQSGRDTTTVTNDTNLMKYIIYALSSLCMTLIIGLITCLKMFIKLGKRKDFYKEQTLLHAQSEEAIKQLRELHDSYISKK